MSGTESVTFVPMAAVAEESGWVDLSQTKSVGELKGKSYRQFADGDLLIAKITPSMENGKAAVVRGLLNGCGYGSTEFHVLRPSPAILADYLLQFVLQRGFRARAARSMTGTAGQLRVPPDFLRNCPVPLPPLEEQRRIVTSIEEHVSRLTAAEDALQSAMGRLKRMRTSVLEEVTSGDWPARPLGEILVSLRNGCFVSRPKPEPPGIPILRISSVRPLDLTVTDIRYAPGTLERAAEFAIQEGDVLFTRYSGNPNYVGACATVPPSGTGLLHPDKLIRGVPDANLVQPEWIALLMTASTGRREIEKRLKTTAGQVGIAGSQLKSVPIPLPALWEQAERIEQWDRMVGSISRLVGEVESARRRSDRARRSILGAALFGQLIPQDSQDEPALPTKRPQAERVTAAAGTHGRRRQES